MNWTKQQVLEYEQRRQQNTGRLGAVSNPKREQSDLPALVKSPRRSRKGKTRMVARVVIISLRHKAVDGDNLAAGAKWLRDAIAKQIGCDDAEGAGIEWEYGQIITRGEQGVIVRIEAIKRLPKPPRNAPKMAQEAF